MPAFIILLAAQRKWSTFILTGDLPSKKQMIRLCTYAKVFYDFAYAIFLGRPVTFS